MLSRRRLCQGMLTSFASAAGISSQISWAGDLNLHDRIEQIYSNQFLFNKSGEPIITIGIREHRRHVHLYAPGGLIVLPSGDGGTSVVGGAHWKIEVENANVVPAIFGIVLDTVPSHDLRRVEQMASVWKKRGIEVSTREIGALFGIQGHVLDTRRTLILAGKFDAESTAQSEAIALKNKHPALGRIHSEIRKRPNGLITAIDLERGTKIRAHSVLWFRANNGGPITLRESQFQSKRSEKIQSQYRGQIYVALDRQGLLSVVNRVSETNLLAGVVPAEIYPQAEQNALKAQAIAARGQLLAKLGERHHDSPFLLCSSTHCQVYSGLSEEDPRCSRAVEKTKGLVLMRPDKRHLVDTVYSANCGGHTEDNENVWPSSPDAQLRGRIDPLAPAIFRPGINESNLHQWLRTRPPAYSNPSPKNSAENDSYRWQVDLPASIFRSNQAPQETHAYGRLKQLKVIERGRSGRAITIQVHTDRGEFEIRGELRIRRALGGLKSSMFIVESTSSQGIRLVGGGYGHGVGMCQNGAMGMARSGKSFSEILQHYYRYAQLKQLW